MGGSSSRRRNNVRTPIPPYTGGGISRPGVAGNPGLGNASPINRVQQQELMLANQQIANLSNQLQATRGGAGGMGMSPYNTPGLYGHPPYAYPGGPMIGGGGGGYRDTDFAAVAHIAGLNPGDVALLHREFLNLTRGGANKMDRTVFRQLLRDILLEVNNEHVDRTIENMFVTIDRNRDGFIDFPEFVGAFKDVLKGHVADAPPHFDSYGYPDLLGDQLRASGVGSGIAGSMYPQQIAYIQQPQVAPQYLTTGGLNVLPLASTGIQQAPIMYSAATPAMQVIDASAPLLTLDQSQTSCVIATPGQYLITQPTAIQYTPLPIF